MKSFIEICQMTQGEVKNYMRKYLSSKQYKVIDEDGFLYAKGTIPVLLVAHMDTVHSTVPHCISQTNGKILSPQGIGGDDRCGIFIIANIVKELHCSVLLCEDEEIGGVGAHKFVETNYIHELDVNYMIEFDRKGNQDAVFYSCDNEEFTEFVIKNTGFQKAFGSYSDISTLMPASKLCAVNLSSGYYNAHTKDEYVMYDEMLTAIEVGKKLINAPCSEPFEYKARAYDRGGWGNFNSYYQNTMQGYNNSYSNLAQTARRDIELELEAIFIDDYGEENLVYATGSTKAECWLDLFTSYSDLSFNRIVDYSFT